MEKELTALITQCPTCYGWIRLDRAEDVPEEEAVIFDSEGFCGCEPNKVSYGL